MAVTAVVVLAREAHVTCCVAYFMQTADLRIMPQQSFTFSSTPRVMTKMES